jgi:hypothetical protein
MKRREVSLRTGVLYLTVFATIAIGRGARAAQPYEFTALHQTYAGYSWGPTASAIAEFTPAGAVPGSISPLDERVRYLTRGSAANYYGWIDGAFYAIDRATGSRTNISTGSLSTSYVDGITYDSLRDRVLITSLESEGYIAAWSVSTQQWTMVTPDLQQLDIQSLCYYPGDDCLYALTVERDGASPRLLRYSSSDGQLVASMSTSMSIPVSPWADNYYDYQLIAADDRLALIIPPDGPPIQPATVPPSRLYLIDPANGQVTHSGALSVPEPGIVGLLIFAGLTCLGRRACVRGAFGQNVESSEIGGETPR